jgi:hypothetical protein
MSSPWIRGRRVVAGFGAAALLAVSGVGLAAVGAQAAAPPPLQYLPKTVRLVPAGVMARSRRLGFIAPGTAWTFDLILPSRDPAGLSAYADAVSTPGSADYRRFLTPGQVMARFGPNPSLVAALRQYLTSRGFASRLDGQLLAVTGSVGRIDGLFATRLASFRHDGLRFIAPAGAITIPGPLRQAAGITGLSTPLVAPLGGTVPMTAQRVVRWAPEAAMKPAPPGTTTTAQNGGFTVQATLLTRGARTPGLAVHYLITATLNGQPDTSAYLAGLAGPITGAGSGIDGTLTNSSGQFVIDFTVSQAQTVSLQATVEDASGNTVVVQLPPATFSGPAANTCSTTLFGLPASEAFPIVCPWNPATNPVNAAFDATGLVSQARRTGPPHLAVYTAGNVVDVSAADVSQFAKQFRLPLPHLSVAYQGPNVCTVSACGSGIMFDIEAELSLDLQMMETAAPGSDIQVYEAGSLRSALNQVVMQDTANVFSVSYGAGELAEYDAIPNAQATWDLLAEEANIEGITVSVAAGDSGAYGGAEEGLTAPMPEYPSNSANVSALGGLEAAVGPTEMLNQTALWGGNLGRDLPPEVLLSFLEMENMMATGGVSSLVPLPLYQAPVVKPGTFGRTTPDYSLPASVVTPGYFGYIDGAPYFIGGTSAAAPLFAGYMADLDNVLHGRLGNVNDAIYPLALLNPAMLVPVAFGNNGVYSVTPGYNAATGLGGLNLDALEQTLITVLSGASRQGPPHHHGRPH